MSDIRSDMLQNTQMKFYIRPKLDLKKTRVQFYIRPKWKKKTPVQYLHQNQIRLIKSRVHIGPYKDTVRWRSTIDDVTVNNFV